MNIFKDNRLEITLEEGTRNIISWIGKSEAPDPLTVLMPYFQEHMEKLKGKELEIKFEALTYMNSSTVSLIIKLIKDLEENSIESTITYDKNSKWQFASFKAIETIVKKMMHIKVVGI